MIPNAEGGHNNSFLNDDFMSNPAFYSLVYGEMLIQ